MKLKLRAAASGALALGVASALLIGGAVSASAATPPYEPDTINQLGQIVFYDSSGNVVTTGNINTTPIATYAVATTDKPAADTATKATLFGYLPVNGVAPGAWSGEALSASTTFPVASGPSVVTSLSANRPVVTSTAADTNLATLLSDFPHPAGDTGTAYDGLYQLRLKIAGEAKWWAADVQISGSTWTLVYPTVNTATSTTLTASPTSPQTLPTPGATPATVTLTATPTAGVAGSVQFTRNGSNLGSPVAVSGGTAIKTDVPAGPASGGAPVTTAYGAIFTPSDAPVHAGSSATPLNYIVQNVPADVTTTDLSISGLTGLAGSPASLSSHVVDTTTPATTPAGSVSWYDNGSATALNPSPVAVDGTGHASYAVASGVLAAGGHSIVAVFTPTNAATFNGSSSTAGTFTLLAANDPCTNAASQCTDPQPIDVNVDAGTLVISTPYTAASPFHLGTMALDANGFSLHASNAFGDATHPAQGVTITDQRAGDLPWTASAYAGDFVSGSNVINGQNLAFKSVTAVPVAGNALGTASKPVTVNDVTSSATVSTPYAAGATGTDGLKGNSGTQHSFAHAAHGIGSINVVGILDLYAPTSTPAGTYTNVVTFTIA